jgi:hypothetical protein
LKKLTNESISFILSILSIPVNFVLVSLFADADANTPALVVYTWSASAEEASGERVGTRLLSIAGVGALTKRIFE